MYRVVVLMALLLVFSFLSLVVVIAMVIEIVTYCSHSHASFP